MSSTPAPRPTSRPQPTTYPAHPVTSATPALRPADAPLSTKGRPAPTATYPSDPAAVWADPTGYPTDWLADRTQTAVLPVRPLGRPAPAPIRPQPEEPSPAIQDMGRPGILRRPSMAWHPSLMQLAIGAALVAALLGACNVAAINAHREARAYCHALVVSDWERAERECRGTGAGTPVPEQVPTAPAAPSQDASAQPEQAAPAAPATPAPTAGRPDWVTRDTGSPYSKDDPAASPLDLPRCTTAPDTPMPCLAWVSADSRHVTVLEEDASLTGLSRR